MYKLPSSVGYPAHMTTPNAEAARMGEVDMVPWGPTEQDEEAVLDRLFGRDPLNGLVTFRIGSLIANTAATAINYAQRWIGTKGRPNVFTRAYAEQHGDEFLRAAWCDMFLNYVAEKAPAPAMFPHGDRAYTVWHAQDFEKLGQAKSGTVVNIKNYAVPGTIIFFDWNGTNSIGAVDHVGIVVKNLGDGRLVVCEGNTSDMVALRVRGADVIAVICLPAYVAEPVTPPKDLGDAWPYQRTTLMVKGWSASAGVAKVQDRINDLGYRPKLIVDGDFGSKTEAGVRWVQGKFKIIVDGIVGPITWGKLFS